MTTHTIHNEEDADVAAASVVHVLARVIVETGTRLDDHVCDHAFAKARGNLRDISELADAITCVLDLHDAAIASLEEDQP